ncbi:Nibrin [Melipona quadrifasciata]|uniref:Nibrin n=1 Tax=Melipona quadrifasciata TaxID=166423 RepID=A0A0M9AB78_9HYME|nr:Nibrin [Melipona quadrifasciata]
MWYLIDQEGHCVYLKPNQETVIGRKKGDIILSNDTSISREHALISVTQLNDIMSNEPTSICKLKDLKSKYGTFILREEEIIQITETEYNLKHQDKIRFGLLHHIFEVMNMSIITITSTLPNEEVERLKNLMEEIDGVIIRGNTWSKAFTYLTVGKAVLTLKLVCAMASALPIVTMKYWDGVKFAINNGQPLPDPNNFVPPIGEVLVTKEKISVSRNEKRMKLFEELTFVHFSKAQYKTYKTVIRIAVKLSIVSNKEYVSGGKSKLFYTAGLTTAELCAQNIIVLQYPDSDMTQSSDTIFSEYNIIKDAFQANNRRMISETEIPLAILHCSTEKYCNPMYKFAKLLKRQEPKCDSSENSNLDTQNLMSNVNYNIPVTASMNIKQHIIPETLNINSQESPLQRPDFAVTQANEKGNHDKSRNCDCTNIKQHIIDETLNVNSQESLQRVDFVRSYDKSRNCDNTNIKQCVIPETLITINSQKSDIDFVMTQPTKKQRYNKSHYIEETPNDENNSNVSLQIAQYSNHDNQNLHKHKNIQDEKQLQKPTILNDDKTERKAVIQPNENSITNPNKDLTRNNSDNLTSHLIDNNNKKEKQSTTCSIDNRTIPENLKETMDSHSSTSEDRTLILRVKHSKRLSLQFLNKG